MKQARPAALALAFVDMRTREGRLLRSVRDRLTAHVGGTPTATQGILIERAAMLSLHIATLDARRAERGELAQDELGQHLAQTAALAAILEQLGLGPATLPRASVT